MKPAGLKAEKGKKSMSYSKFRKALNNVLLHYVKRAQPLFERYEREFSGPLNNYAREQAEGLMNRISDTKSGSLEELDEVYEDYLDRLDEKAKSISGSDVDKADLALLESTLYTLNQEEFDVLQDKYEGNRSMERILSGYAEKRGQEGVDINKVLHCRFMSDKEKRDLAARLYKECGSWIKNDGGFGIAEYVLQVAGDMFLAADQLKE